LSEEVDSNANSNLDD